MKTTSLEQHPDPSPAADTSFRQSTTETLSLANGKLGEIQEILFGTQLRHHTEQIAALQSKFTQHIDEIVQDHKRQLAEVRKALEQTQAQFERRLVDHENQQQKNLDAVANKLNTSEIRLIEQVTKTSDGALEIKSDVERQVSQLTDQLSESIRLTREELIAQLERTSGDIESRKLDRISLSTLLETVALQLSQDSSSIDQKHQPAVQSDSSGT